MKRSRPISAQLYAGPIPAAAISSNRGDTRYWVDHATYPPDEIAVRFSHRLVARNLGQAPFTWGRANLVDAGETRARYVETLQAADNHDIVPLLLFARS